MSNDSQQVTFLLPKQLHSQMKIAAAGEDLFIAEAYASAARNWLDSMNGKGPTYRPTNTALHNQLEILLNRRDSEITATISAILNLLDRVEK